MHRTASTSVLQTIPSFCPFRFFSHTIRAYNLNTFHFWFQSNWSNCFSYWIRWVFREVNSNFSPEPLQDRNVYCHHRHRTQIPHSSVYNSPPKMFWSFQIYTKWLGQERMKKCFPRKLCSIVISNWTYSFTNCIRVYMFVWV